MKRSSWLYICTLNVLLMPIFFGFDSVQAKKTQDIQRLEIADALKNSRFTPLNAEQIHELANIQADPAPEEIVRNSHYWVSNEHNHQLWHSYIQDLGGAYVGVGTDQNYLLAAWAKSSVLMLMDFDQEIPTIHEIYAYFFSISGTPQTFLDRWSRRYADDSAEKLSTHFTAIAEQLARKEAAAKNLSEERSVKYINRRVKRYVRHRVKIYKRTRGLLWRRLSKTKSKYQKLKIATFLDQQEQYEHIRDLWASGRVIAIRGDLTANQTMIDIARALRNIGETLSVLYLSNAEQYFLLTPEYRRNIINLPWSTKSYALRTMAWGSLGFYDEKEEYHYNIQTGENFVTWMQESRTTKAGRMLFKGRKLKINPGFSEMVKLPVKSKRKPKVAKLPKSL